MLESRSERCFGSRSKTWLGSWFELRAFTCIANAFQITIRICALRGNILLLLRSPHALIDPCAKCMASARIFKMHTHESRSERALRSHVLESGFLGGSWSKTPLFFAFSKAWFETALRSHGLKSGFQIRKGPNHVLKLLSERDSSPCEHSLCLFVQEWFYKLNFSSCYSHEQGEWLRGPCQQHRFDERRESQHCRAGSQEHTRCTKHGKIFLLTCWLWTTSSQWLQRNVILSQSFILLHHPWMHMYYILWEDILYYTLLLNYMGSNRIYVILKW